MLFAEAASADDAFGAMTLTTLSPGRLNRRDRSYRVTTETADKLVLTAWQGKVLLRVTFTGIASEDHRTLCRQLFDRIVFAVPYGEPPMMLEVIPPERQADCKLWLVRSATAFEQSGDDALKRINAKLLDARLGLQPGMTLSVAAVRSEQDAPLNVLFLVAYPTADAAKAAHDRYTQAIKSPQMPLDRNTVLGALRGNVLFGSWSAGTEATHPLLPMLKQALPE